jgi:hypothetical protein
MSFAKRAYGTHHKIPMKQAANLFRNRCGNLSDMHVVIVPHNNSYSAMALIAILYATCRLMDLSIICVSLNGSNSLITRSIGKNQIRFLQNVSVEDKYGILKQIAQEARELRCILLIDGVLDGSIDEREILKSLDLRRKESISMVVPLSTAEDIENATSSVSKIDPDYCVIQAIDIGYASLDKHKDYKFFLCKYPVFRCESLPNDIISVFNRSESFEFLPHIDKMVNYYNQFSEYIDAPLKKRIAMAIDYFNISAIEYDRHIFINFCHESF